MVQIILMAGAKLSFLAVAVLLYKALPVADVGLFSIVYAIAIILATISEFGLRGLLVRELARNRDSAPDRKLLLAGAIKSRLLTLLPYYATGLIAAWFFVPGQSMLILLLLLSAAWLDSNSMVFRGALRAHNFILLDATVAGLSRAILLFATAYLFWQESLTLIAFAALFATVAAAESLVTAVLIIHKTKTPLSLQINLAQTLHMIKRGLPFIMVNILGIIYLRVAILLLGIIPSYAALDQVAGFNLSGRIPEGVMFLPIALMNAAIPFFARASGRPADLIPVFHQLERLLGCAGILISAGLIAYTEQLILLLATAEYLQFAPVFQIYSATLFFSFLQYTYANMLICLDHEKMVAKRYAFILVLNILLNVALIWYAGALGAVLALLSCEAVALGIDLTFLRKYGITPAGRTLVSWALVLVCSIGLAFLLAAVLPSPTGAALYFTIAGLFGAYLLAQAQLSHYSPAST